MSEPDDLKEALDLLERAYTLALLAHGDLPHRGHLCDLEDQIRLFLEKHGIDS
jgi:hypothetical protein